MADSENPDFRVTSGNSIPDDSGTRSSGSIQEHGVSGESGNPEYGVTPGTWSSGESGIPGFWVNGTRSSG